MPGSVASILLQPGSYRPLTMAIRLASTPDRAGTTPFESAGSASGLASRINARRSVYFHSSMRRCGRPLASKRRNASSRSATTAPLPGNLPRVAAKAELSACSAGVFMASHPRTSGRLTLELGIAFGLELERELLAAGLHDAAVGQNMHDVRHDVIEQSLIV